MPAGEWRVHSVIIAQGGAGALFAHNTYPMDIVGSSGAAAYRADVPIRNLNGRAGAGMTNCKPVQA